MRASRVLPHGLGSPVGVLLRGWRERGRLSQLELALSAGMSARHLSFIETGRSQASRETIAQLSDALDLTLRERNRFLLAAGFAPIYSHDELEAPQLELVRAAIRRILTAHEPYPAIVIDRYHNLVDANATSGLFTKHCASSLLVPPVNVLRLTLHPDGLAPHIINLPEWRGHLLGSLRREVESSGDNELNALYLELKAYPISNPAPESRQPSAADICMTMRMRDGDRELAFYSTIATFGTPFDVTVAELSIESFFPADRATAHALNSEALSLA
jgi:transcriptional regulator with XRE-family HTH domain